MPSIKFFLLLALSIASYGCAFVVPSKNWENRRSVIASFSPTDIPEVSSFVLAKYDTKMLGIGAFKNIGASTRILDPDVQAQVLSDGSHALMDFPNLFNKPSKLQMRYAQVIGRLMIIGIGLLPNHSFHPEEMAVQLLLLGVSMKPVIRSIKLYKCITSTKCLEECELELHDLESSLP